MATTNNGGPGRTQPIVEWLLADQALHEPVYPGADQQLAEALRHIDDAAGKVGFRYDGREGYTPAVQEFVRANLAG